MHIATARQTILADALLPAATRAQNALLVVGASLFVALCAQVSLPLPFSPVPVTGQTFAVLLLATTLGARRSAAALLLYLAEGAVGLPVFAPGGLPGLARLFGPTGGYLFAFPVAAFLLGWTMERPEASGPRKWWLWLAAALAAEVFILFAGTAWLRLAVGLPGWSEAAQLGLWPFLPGSLLKALLVAACLPASWWAASRAQVRTGS
ncbi:MAG: biotin transporter BioY [Candidatus Acidiferrales bacterium]